MHQQHILEARLAELISNQMLRVAQEEEEKLDQQISKLENLDEDDFEQLREKRKQDLIKKQRKMQDWYSNGHGRVTEIADQQGFFDAYKKSERLIIHFYRPTTPRCEILDGHFEKLAPAHPETRFCKLNAEKAPFICERLHIYVIPTLLLVQDGVTVHQIVGFDEMGGVDDFSTQTFSQVLIRHRIIDIDQEGFVNPLTGKTFSTSNEDGPKNSIREGGVKKSESDDELDAFMDGI